MKFEHFAKGNMKPNEHRFWPDLNSFLIYKPTRWVFDLLVFVGILIYFISTVAVIGLLLNAFAPVSESSAVDQSETLRNLALVLAAMLGAPLILWRTLVAAQQAKIAEDGLFNEKITSAAKDLSAMRRSGGGEETDLVLRMAAIDQLNDLANERADQKFRVVKILASYLRANFPVTEPLQSRARPRRQPPMDQQNAVDVIGKINNEKIYGSDWARRIDLSHCDFEGVSFKNGNFWAADFERSNLIGCNFQDTNLTGCQFVTCNLDSAHFKGAILKGAHFSHAQVREHFDPNKSITSAKTLEGASFWGGDFGALDTLEDLSAFSNTFGTRDVQLRAAQDCFDSEDHEAIRNFRKLPNAPGGPFKHWVPLHSNNQFSSVVERMDEFLESKGMKVWPYGGRL